MPDFLNQFVEAIHPYVREKLPSSEITLDVDEMKVRISSPTHQDERRPHQRYQPIIIQIHDDFDIPSDIDASLRSKIEAFIQRQLHRIDLQTTPSADIALEPVYIKFPENC